MFLSNRAYPISGAAPLDGGVSEHKLTPGMILAGILISIPFSVNVTTAGNAVRAYSLPLKRALLTGKDGTTLQMWRASDLVRIAQIYEQAPIAGLVTPPGGFAIANYANCRADIPLMFEQPRVARAINTGLPSWEYGNDLTLRLEWGSVTDLLTGAPVGPITFGAVRIVQLDHADIPIGSGQGRALANAMPVSIGRYIEQTQLGVANPAWEFDLGNTTDIRGLLITSELTSTGEPTDTIINTLTLKEDNSKSVHESVPWGSLRALNSRHFGLTLPAGCAVFDFAEDGDYTQIYRATRRNKVKLITDSAAVGGTVRVAMLTIAPPRNFG